jgi:hypothetical protein
VTAMARADGVESLEWDLKETRPGSAGFLKIETRSYRMPDGQVADWDIIRGGRTVAMVAITEDGQVLLALLPRARARRDRGTRVTDVPIHDIHVRALRCIRTSVRVLHRDIGDSYASRLWLGMLHPQRLWSIQ